MSKFRTTPKMNAAIKNILRMWPVGQSPYEHYAAQRIEELEQENADLRQRLESMEIAKNEFYNNMLRYKKAAEDLLAFHNTFFGEIEKRDRVIAEMAAHYRQVISRLVLQR